MFVSGDYVYHVSYGVCKVGETRQIKMGSHTKTREYCQLQPLDDEHGTTIFVPVEDFDSAKIRRPVSIDEANHLIDELPVTQPVEIAVTGNKMLDRETLNSVYRSIRDSGKPEESARLLRTFFLKRDELSKQKKKLSEYETNIWEQLEDSFFKELAFSLNIPTKDVTGYITTRLGV